MPERPTRRRILDELREDPLQAQTVGDHLELDTSVAYRHLERLRDEGLVEADRVVEGPGRPKKVYTLTEAGWETFERHYELLLSVLLSAIEAEDGRERVEAYLARIAEDLASPLADVRGEDRLEALVEVYDDLGFQAHLETDGDDLVLVQRNCPFRQVAREDPEALCEHLDEGIQRQAFPEAEIELEQTMARGAHRCRHRIRLDPEQG